MAIAKHRNIWPVAWLCWHLDRVQGRPGHQIQADTRTASGLRLPDHFAERRRRADPSKGDAGHFDQRRRMGRLDARALRRSEGAAATVAG
jgi:hypothetical protein